MRIIYVYECCGGEWDKEVGFCPICYTDLIPEAEWNKKQAKKKQKIKKRRGKRK